MRLRLVIIIQLVNHLLLPESLLTAAMLVGHDSCWATSAAFLLRFELHPSHILLASLVQRMHIERAFRCLHCGFLAPGRRVGVRMPLILFHAAFTTVEVVVCSIDLQVDIIVVNGGGQMIILVRLCWLILIWLVAFS